MTGSLRIEFCKVSLRCPAWRSFFVYFWRNPPHTPNPPLPIPPPPKKNTKCLPPSPIPHSHIYLHPTLLLILPSLPSLFFHNHPPPSTHLTHSTHLSPHPLHFPPPPLQKKPSQYHKQEPPKTQGDASLPNRH
eukprot:Sspe_Gene.54359::Locus_30009_Transcript_1_1_Confidence_1.000_Length_893::g.54359::m.54359